MDRFAQRLAADLRLAPRGVDAVVHLLDGGATVPFIARYRKEASGGLDEVQIRDVAERAAYLRDLDARRETILRSIESQGRLTDSLARRIRDCASKTALEDLYLPYKPKRRTRAAIARERGLEPLALQILEQPQRVDPARAASAFVDVTRGVSTTEEAIDGASDIVVEMLSERSDVRGFVRQTLAGHGLLTSRVVDRDAPRRTKFEDYYDYREPLRRVASHRYLAVCRGEAEAVLRVRVEIDEARVLAAVERMAGLRPGSSFASILRDAVREAYKRRLHPAIEKELRTELRHSAEHDAVDVFAQNLRDLLLAAPFGARPVLAVDPGLRTGCKCVALGNRGDVSEQATIYLSASERQKSRAEETLLELVRRHRPDAIAVGNGTGGRDAERFARESLERGGIDRPVVSVNEAGASVYSASELARTELPDLDVTIRGAVSIGRRLQDPLAELVKIDPAAIGVGQYQHDVDAGLLARKLGEVVESCVNAVGVELNTASAPLLSHVAGVGPRLAAAIVEHRSRRGAFAGRRDLLDVKGLGPRAFEQCAGFLRVRDATHPLDASAVHPERYGLVERMARDLDVNLAKLVGDAESVERIDPGRYRSEEVGEPTLRDILSELAKPGRDPRDTFETLQFRDDVKEIEDLREGMLLDGIVTNVAAFGAFVDVGVHQDGLVHVSELADRFIKDPHDEVRAGQRVRVRVLSVDVERRRVSLSRKSPG